MKIKQFEVRSHYRTRDGRKVRCLAVDAAQPFTHIFMLKGNNDGSADGSPYPTNSEGKAFIGGGDHNLDVLGPWVDDVEIYGWVNIYRYDISVQSKAKQTITLYATKELAREACRGQAADCIYLTSVARKGFP